eukprot:GHVU01020192.1.p1 GENE.GHVU01020192.1~~GHVU01020192.1.p1  ORF type:complete len:210 (+),score=19.05 GHVU01020192.1:278-907(+)
MTGCPQLNDISTLANISASLTYLDLRGSSIPDTNTQGVPGSGAVFATLTKLTKLCLSSTPVGRSTFTAVTSSCPDLEVLDFSHVARAAEIANSDVVQMALSLPKLQRVRISSMPNLTNSGVRSMFSQLPRLQHLDISNCRNVKPTVLDDDIVFRSDAFGKLVITNCPQLDANILFSGLAKAGVSKCTIIDRMEQEVMMTTRIYRGLSID